MSLSDGLARQFGEYVFGQGGEVDRVELLQQGVAVEAGEEQDLLHQGADPLDAATDLQQAAGVGLGVFRTQRDLGMGAQAGQWRADFMGGVAGQSAFGLEGGAQTLQQEVEFVDEAADLQRHRFHRDRLQVSRGALLDLGLHFA